MSNITNIFGASYGNGIIPFFHKDDNGNIISKKVTGRTYTIKESVVVLEEFPDLQYGFDIIINNLNGKSFDNNSDISVDQKLARVEKNYLSLEENEYIVDITTGFIHFHPNLNGVEIKVDDYYGKGLWLIDDTRVIAEVIKKRNTDGTYSYDYKNLADTITSAKGFISKGTWKKDVKYDINNIVEYGGVIYIAKKSDGNSDQSPTTKDSEYWDAVIDVNSIIENHADDIASDSNYGHVKLTNATNLDYGVGKGVAATPKAVKDVMDKTNDNTTAIDTHIGDIGNPHKVTKAQVELGNVPNVSTNNQTPTYTMASTLSNLTSGEKLSAAFGKISKAISDYMSNKADVENALETLSSNIEGIISLNKFENIDLDTLKDEGLYYLKYTDVANIQDGTYHLPTIYSDEYTDIWSDLTLIVSKTETRITEKETTSGGIIIKENPDILINQVLFTHAGIYFRGYQASKGTYSSWEKVITSEQILDATETTKGLVTLSYDYTPPGDDEAVLQPETSEAAHIEAVQNAYGELKSMIDTLDNKINSNGGSGNGDGSQTTDGGFIGGEDASATSGGAIGCYANSISGGAVGCSAKAMDGGAIGGGTETEQGGAVGHYASSVSGFAGGEDASTNNGGAIGQNSNATNGGAVGYEAVTETGGAVGDSSSSTTGGAVGQGAKTTIGFAGGYNAQTLYYPDEYEDYEELIDAIQLGTGTNSEPKTLQVYDYKLMNADGTIPTDRVVNANIKKNPSATTGDIIGTHLTVGTRGTGAIGDKSLSSGSGVTASGDYSVALGGTGNAANAQYSSILGGQNNKIDPKCESSAIIGGKGNSMYGGGDYFPIRSVILGGLNNRIPEDVYDSAILGGQHNYISNYGTACCSAIVGGYYAIATDYNTAIGRYNISPQEGYYSGVDGDVFTIGIGTSSARKNGFRVAYTGDCFASLSINSTGADYAECFEWVDSNPENEDRVGLMTAFEGDKIRLANADDPIEIIGIISAIPAVVGDNYADEWCGKYLKDKYGRLITEHKVYAEVLDDEGNVIKSAYEADEYVLNPDYNPDEKYIPRLERPEYDAVGTHGKLVVRDDGSCKVGGFCRSGENGIATASESGFYVMERIDDETIRVYLK